MRNEALTCTFEKAETSLGTDPIQCPMFRDKADSFT